MLLSPCLSLLLLVALRKNMVALSQRSVLISASEMVAVFDVPSHLLSRFDISDIRGFDITGVTTEIDLTFPKIKNECDCIKACLDRPTTCNNYVWKFSTPESVAIGHRTCTLCTTSLVRLQLITSRLQFQPSA